MTVSQRLEPMIVDEQLAEAVSAADRLIRFHMRVDSLTHCHGHQEL